jgi:arabinogalactan oligomer / maltooligosaccharide transport system substrate-binding protein
VGTPRSRRDPTEEETEEVEEEAEEEAEEETEEEGEEEEAARRARRRRPRDLGRRHPHPRDRALRRAFAEEQGITVAVQEVPFDQIRDDLVIQGPAGEGPDVFIGAHDWLGGSSRTASWPRWTSADAGDYLEVATQAFNYDGTNYGLPYSIENIALVRNTDLAPEPVPRRSRT